MYFGTILFVLLSSVAFGQISVTQFNAGWNESNEVNWVHDLTEVKTISYVDIAKQADMAKKDEGFLSSNIAPESVDARMVSLATDTTTASTIKPQEAVYEALAAKVLNPNENIADGMTSKNEFFRYQDAITVDPEIDTDNYITIKVGD